MFVNISNMSKMKSILRTKGLKLFPSVGDGHCLIYSVCTSWNTQCHVKKPIDSTIIKEKLFVESTCNYLNYSEFLLSNNRHRLFFKGLAEYTRHKKYNSHFGDLVPRILANALKVNLIVFDEISNNRVDEFVFQPSDGISIDTISVHRRRELFTGVGNITMASCQIRT